MVADMVVVGCAEIIGVDPLSESNRRDKRKNPKEMK